MHAPRRCVAIDSSTREDEAALSWARRLAHETGAELIETPRSSARAVVLDVASKHEVEWLVTALRWQPDAPPGTAVLDGDVAMLVRRARCPVLTVQPWVEPPRRRPRTAVVGVDGSGASRAAAQAAARLLTLVDTGIPTLILAYGCETHPAELATASRWQDLVDAASLERNRWLRALADELRSPGLAVDVVSHLAWVPELIGGLAQRADADFAALGAAARREGSDARLGRLHQHVLRSTPCPLLTANPLADTEGLGAFA